MVLVDTAFWIRFLLNRSPNAAALDRLLAAGEAAGHERIYGELLIGDRGGRAKFLAASVVERIPLWTAHPRLAVLAVELGVAHPLSATAS